MSHNTWIHRLARVAIVRPLAATPVTPNQLTTLRLAGGLAAAAFLATGAAPWIHVGGAVFVVSMVLDRADGELARATGRTSARGHVYDLWADALSNALAFVGLGIGLGSSELGMWAIPMGVLAGGAIAAVLWMTVRMEALGGERAAELGSFAGFDPDDAVLAVPVAVWLGWSLPLLWAATIGAPAFALLFAAILYRRRTRARRPTLHKV